MPPRRGPVTPRPNTSMKGTGSNSRRASISSSSSMKGNNGSKKGTSKPQQRQRSNSIAPSSSVNTPRPRHWDVSLFCFLPT
jgi:hypothetical protein